MACSHVVRVAASTLDGCSGLTVAGPARSFLRSLQNCMSLALRTQLSKLHHELWRFWKSESGHRGSDGRKKGVDLAEEEIQPRERHEGREGKQG